MKSFYKLLYFAKIIFATSSIFLACLYSQSASIKVDHITINDGLSQSTVHSILQDSRGFMWFGTQDGLNKYDGYSFTIYKHDPYDSTTISDNYIRCIYEDHSGTLWIGTENGGLNRFNRGKEIFENFRHDPAKSNSLANNHVWDIVEDNDGFLWIGTWGDGLEKFDIQKNKFTHFRHDPKDPNSLSDNRVRCLYYDQEGFLWVGTEEGGLNRFNLGNNTFKHYQHNPDNSSSISHNLIQDIREDNQGNLWVGTKYGINRFNREKETFTRHSLTLDWPWTEVTSILEDVDGYLWIGAVGYGLCKFDSKTGSFQYYTHNPNNPYSLSESGILILYRDRSGLIWTGTRGGGLNQFDPTPKFRYYTHIPNDPNSLSAPSIRAIYEDQDSVLWVGVYGGLDKFDRKTGSTKHFSFDINNPNGMQNDNVYAITEDIDGSLWIGIEGGGLYHFNQQSEIFTPYLHSDNDPFSIAGDFIFKLLMDTNGNLWIGTDAGLSQLTPINKKKGRFINYTSSLGGATVNSIIQAQQGSIWVGTAMSGLFRLDMDTESFINYTHSESNPRTISSDRIKCIYLDQSDHLWIGTNGGGLNQFDFTSQTFKHYTEKDGLPNDVVYGILEDDHKNLWLSTNKGISKFNPAENTFRNFDIRDGLQSNEFNTGAYYKSWTGEMFFGGISGLNAFFPDRIQDDIYSPPIVITDFRILNEPVPIGVWEGNRSILQNCIAETDVLTLSYKDRAFSFMFVALDFSVPDKNQYAYKMEGFDPDWINTVASKRFAAYTHLPAGEYIFKVKGTNHDGIWNEEGVSLPIIITPPPWKTWWAYFAFYLAILVLFFGIIEWRFRRVKKQTVLLEQQVDERTIEIQNHKKEIEQQNQFLHSVIESLSQPFYVIDAKTNKTILKNSAAKQRADSGGIYCHSLLFGTDKTCNLSGNFCPLPEVKKTKKLVKFEREHVDRNGKTNYAEITAFPIFDNNGNVVQMIEYWSDITARKELENTLKENLENRNKKLTSKAMRMTKDREILIDIMNEVQTLYEKSQAENKFQIKSIISKLNEQIDSGTEWDEFELWFQEVHSDFYQNLGEICSDLTLREQKICAFLKLNLNTKEIASLTNLTVKTIEVYRSQLRKKLNIQQGDNLVKFISDL
ncbi:MAG: two-component regulator propeller domain-containing protein [Fidelibacterota bacterium]